MFTHAHKRINCRLQINLPQPANVIGKYTYAAIIRFLRKEPQMTQHFRTANFLAPLNHHQKAAHRQCGTIYVFPGTPSQHSVSLDVVKPFEIRRAVKIYNNKPLSPDKSYHTLTGRE